MSKEVNGKVTILFVLSVSFIAAALTAIFLIFYCSRMQFQTLGNVFGEVMEQCPESKKTILNVLKGKKSHGGPSAKENVLLAFGYGPWDFWNVGWGSVWLAGLGFLTGAALFAWAFWIWRRKWENRVEMVTEYMRKLNTGSLGLLWNGSEDGFSRLQDELYKTVTMLYETRDEAVKAKNNFAENLSNIAHQLKTPITAISLSAQMMSENPSCEYAERIKGQLNRLARLEEALLLLSRIDAGTLVLRKMDVDVYTVLMLASDNLQELFMEAGVSTDIPEMGEVRIEADLNWTMEAVMNLMKNCMEAARAGTTVHCSYEKNPLYVQVRIWDEGEGFAQEDLPHLFKRFYRGKNGGTGGIGIGLALAREIVEMQNGVISGFNLAGGGACFEIRFYSH